MKPMTKDEIKEKRSEFSGIIMQYSQWSGYNEIPIELVIFKQNVIILDILERQAPDENGEYSGLWLYAPPPRTVVPGTGKSIKTKPLFTKQDEALAMAELVAQRSQDRLEAHKRPEDEKNHDPIRLQDLPDDTKVVRCDTEGRVMCLCPDCGKDFKANMVERNGQPVFVAVKED